MNLGKKWLVIAGIIIFVVIAVIVATSSRKGNVMLNNKGKQDIKNVSESYINITIRNGLAKESLYQTNSTKKTQKANINVALSTIEDAFHVRAKVMSNNTPVDLLTKTSKLVETGSYDESLVSLKQNIDSLNTAIKTYQGNYQKDIDEISAVVKKKMQGKYKYAIRNHQIVGSWALVSVHFFNSNLGGPAALILKKESGNWKVFTGPGTFFFTDKLKASGVPEALLNFRSGYMFSTKDYLTPLIY